jgi:prefoldin subunit 5
MFGVNWAYGIRMNAFNRAIRRLNLEHGEVKSAIFQLEKRANEIDDLIKEIESRMNKARIKWAKSMKSRQY